MEKIKAQLQAIKLMLSESVMTEQNLGSIEARTIFSQIKEIESELERMEDKKLKTPFTLPTMKKHPRHKAYMRLLLAVVKEYSDRDKPFTIGEIETKAGSSRTQVRRDLEFLEASGYIQGGEILSHGKIKRYKYRVI